LGDIPDEKAPKEMIVAVHIIDLSSGMIRGMALCANCFAEKVVRRDRG
jgi:hypothetical protein